jgi:hypothetical protein
VQDRRAFRTKRGAEFAFRCGDAIIASVQVQIGPLPADSARAWLAYANDVVAANMKQLPIQVAAHFSAYLAEWWEAAQGGDFLWEGKAEPEEVEYLLHAWFNLAQSVEPGPEEGRVFYNGLVHALLNALRNENRSTAELAEHLAPFWPGLEKQA